MLVLKVDEANRVAYYGPEEDLPSNMQRSECIEIEDPNNDIMLGMDISILDSSFRLKSFGNNKLKGSSREAIEHTVVQNCTDIAELENQSDKHKAKNLYIELVPRNIVKQLVWLHTVLNYRIAETVNISGASKLDLSMFIKEFPNVTFTFDDSLDGYETTCSDNINLSDYPEVVAWLFSNKKYEGSPTFVVAPYSQDNVRATYLADYIARKNFKVLLYKWGDFSLDYWVDKLFESRSPIYFLVVSPIYESFFASFKLVRLLELTKTPFVYDSADNYVDFPAWHLGQSSKYTLKAERWLCENAVKIFASAKTVKELLKDRHSIDATLATNGAFPYSFEQHPKDNAVVTIGDMHSKYDIRFLEKIIKENPSIRFDFYGRKWDVLRWNYPNVQLLGFKPVEEIRQSLSKYKAGLVAFKPEKYVDKGMLPMKTFDYIFADLPIFYNHCPELEDEDFSRVAFKSDKYSLSDVFNARIDSNEFGRLKSKYDLNKSFEMIFESVREDCIRRYGITVPTVDRLVKIENFRDSRNQLKVQIDLGLLCNFHCEYCFQRRERANMVKEDRNKCLEVAKNIGKLKPYIDQLGLNGICLTLLGGETMLYPCVELLKEMSKHVRINVVNIISNMSMPAEILKLRKVCKELNIILSISASYHPSQMDLQTYIDNVRAVCDDGINHLLPYAVVNNDNFEAIMAAARELRSQLNLFLAIGRERCLGETGWTSLDTWKRLELANYYNSKDFFWEPVIDLATVTESGKILSVSCAEEIYNVFGFDNVNFKGAVCNMSYQLTIRRNGDIVFGPVDACAKYVANIFTDDKLPENLDGKLICPLKECPCSCGSTIDFFGLA